MSYSTGTTRTSSTVSTRITYLAETFIDDEILNYMRGQKRRQAYWKQAYKDLARLRRYQFEEKRRDLADTRAQMWAKDVAFTQEKIRLRKAKIASEALLQAEVQRLKEDNEARKYSPCQGNVSHQILTEGIVVRRLKRAERKMKQGEKTAASKRSKRTYKSTLRHN